MGAKRDRDKRVGLLGSSTKVSTTADGNRVERERERQAATDAYLDSQAGTQEMLIQQQDENLGILSSAVRRIGQMGLSIQDELQQQERLIDDYGDEMEGTRGRLKAVQADIKKLMASKDSWMAKCICTLVCALILLTILLFIIPSPN